LDERVIENRDELEQAHISSIIKETVTDEETGETSEVNKEYDNIDERFEDIEAHKKAIADELNAAHVSSVVRTEVQPEEEGGEITYTDTTYDTLDERLEAIESYAVASKNNIDTITAEINGAHRTGLVDENNESINDSLDKRFDDIEAKISHPAENEDVGGLTERLTSLEGEVRHASTGLAATKAIADAAAVKTEVDSTLNGLNTRLNAIDGGEALTGAKTLATRVSEAESAIDTLQNEPKSATEVISVEDFEALTANEANSHKDYLVGPDENNLYKYYHIIETSDNVYEKVLISGGTTGGTSSAQFAATTEEITNPNINTDYYVGNNTDGYLHYRYIENGDNGTLVPILIGVDPKKIKTYNMIKTTGGTEAEPINYLDFYEFNYGESNIITEELPPVEQRIARIVLPQGGGGGSSSVSNTKLVRIAPTSITTIFNG